MDCGVWAVCVCVRVCVCVCVCVGGGVCGMAAGIHACINTPTTRPHIKTHDAPIWFPHCPTWSVIISCGMAPACSPSCSWVVVGGWLLVGGWAYAECCAASSRAFCGGVARAQPRPVVGGVNVRSGGRQDIDQSDALTHRPGRAQPIPPNHTGAGARARQAGSPRPQKESGRPAARVCRGWGLGESRRSKQPNGFGERWQVFGTPKAKANQEDTLAQMDPKTSSGRALMDPQSRPKHIEVDHSDASTRHDAAIIIGYP